MKNITLNPHKALAEKTSIDEIELAERSPFTGTACFSQGQDHSVDSYDTVLPLRQLGFGSQFANSF